MGPRMNKMSRWRLGIGGCAVFLVFSLMYFYQGSRDYVQTIKMSEKRCLSEQESLTYQLKVVTEYKGKLEKMLREIQDSQKSDKEKYKEIAERCITMKQQSVLCQSQFDDLQSECKKVRDNLNKENIESAKFKEKYLHEQNNNNILKHNMETKQMNIDEVLVELKTLRNENEVLRSNLQKYENDRPVVINNGGVYRPLVNLGNNKRFSKETEVDDGLYLIGQTDVHAGGAEQGKTINMKSHPRSNEKVAKDKKSLEEESKLLPPGVPPVLSVENQDNMIKESLPKVVQHPQETLEHQVNLKKVAPNDRIVHYQALDVVAPAPETDKRDLHKYEEGIGVGEHPGDGVLQEDPAGEAVEVDDGMMQDEDDEDDEIVEQ